MRAGDALSSALIGDAEAATPPPHSLTAFRHPPRRIEFIWLAQETEERYFYLIHTPPPWRS
jgi:hypothetical protein